MKGLLIFLTLLFLSQGSLFAVNGFREFRFGYSPKRVQEEGKKRCTFGKYQQDTRWNWKSTLECSNYRYKGIKTVLYFEFIDDELSRIIVLSRKIPHYSILRRPEEMLLKPMRSQKGSHGKNLADILMFEDKSHQMEPGLTMTQFFYSGNWEWELEYKVDNYQSIVRRKNKAQLDEETEQGVKGWNLFKFDDSLETVQTNLKGFCKNTKIVASLRSPNRKDLFCYEYNFQGDAITIRFSFQTGKLVRINLQFPKKWYSILLPLLKRKYSYPYREVPENPYYLPFIYFPKMNIVLFTHQQDQKTGKALVTLRYQKEGFVGFKKIKRKKRVIQKKKIPRQKTLEENVLETI